MLRHVLGLVGILLLLNHENTLLAQNTEELLITQVNVVTAGETQDVENSNVLVRSGRIIAIGPDSISLARDNVEIINGNNRYLIPGLIDAHTHLNEIPGMTFEHESNYPVVAQKARAQIPRSYLYHGFTTVIDLNASAQTTESWNAAELRPQAYFCGAAPVFDGYPMSFMPQPERYEMMPYFLYDESRREEFPEGYSISNHSPEAVVARIRDDGGICVKTHYERGFGGRGDLPVPTVDLIRELAKAAHNQNMPILLHANSQSSQTFGVEVGVDAFAHGMWTWDDRTATELHGEITSLIDRAIANDIYLQPTIQVLYGEQDIHNPDYLADSRLEEVLPESLIEWYSTDDGQWWRQRMLNIPIVKQLVDDGLWQELDAPPIARVSAALSYFAERSDNLLFGSDTPSDPTFANPPGLNGRLEMNNWIAAGVSPKQLFAAATINNAEFFGLDEEIGSIEIGKQADLLILRENPLVNVSAYDTIETVILKGIVIDRTNLSALSQD